MPIHSSNSRDLSQGVTASIAKQREIETSTSRAVFAIVHRHQFLSAS
jgi:hypothetical protein